MVLVFLGSDAFHSCCELEKCKRDNQMTKQMPACTCSRCSTTKSRECKNISIYSAVLALAEDVILLTPASRCDEKIPSPSVSTNAVLMMLQPDAGLSGGESASWFWFRSHGPTTSASARLYASTFKETEVCSWIQLNKQMGVIAWMFLTTTNPQTPSLFYNEQWNCG